VPYFAKYAILPILRGSKKPFEMDDYLEVMQRRAEWQRGEEEKPCIIV